jgi:hypothetical protein
LLIEKLTAERRGAAKAPAADGGGGAIFIEG